MTAYMRYRQAVSPGDTVRQCDTCRHQVSSPVDNTWLRHRTNRTPYAPA
jgi:hypothetical protein